MKIKKLIKLNQLKRFLAVNAVNCALLKSADEALFNNASTMQFNNLLELIDQALGLLKIKISADITDK